MTSPIDEATFETAADTTLRALERDLEALDLEAEIELSMGILTIEFADGVRYVVNSHRAAKQIWMAAERSAWHFDPMGEGRWIATKSGDDLRDALAGVLSRKLGSSVAL